MTSINSKVFLCIDKEAIFADIADVVRVFLPCQVVKAEEETADICFKETEYGYLIKFCGSLPQGEYAVKQEKCRDSEKINKRRAKLAVYFTLKEHLGVSPPWGALTGIRPSKFQEEFLSQGESAESFKKLFDLSDKKAMLVSDVLTAQEGLKQFDANAANLYIGIPFCISRCSYCSFSGGLLKRYEGLVEPYIDALILEVRDAVSLMRERGIRLKSVYIGGGTPTSLTPRQMERLLAAVPKAEEFTVETGRPDTLNAEHVAIFRNFGVSRVSVNPQTFKQETLDIIDRRHTVSEVYDAYRLVEGKFDVNMDLIAGLPGECLEDFSNSLFRTVQLFPQNITVHTLAIKRGSPLKEKLLNNNADGYGDASEVNKMVDYAYERLKEAGYTPYYLYRQKYMSENLENVGYCQKGKQCRYNVDTMEETTSIIACGAGAISKRVLPPKQIDRLANAKDIALYISRIHETILKKRTFYN